MLSEDFGRLMDQGRMLRERLVAILKETKNVTLRRDTILRRLPWPYFCGARVYDPLTAHIANQDDAMSVRLDVRSGERMVEVEFERNSPHFTIFCDGGQVLFTSGGHEPISVDTGEDAIEMFMNFGRDLAKYDPKADAWKLQSPPRRSPQVRDDLLLRAI